MPSWAVDLVTNDSLSLKLQDLLSNGVVLTTSPLSEVSFEEYERKLAKIPEEAVKFSWIYPIPDMPISTKELENRGWSKEEILHPVVHLLQRGGFRYCDSTGRTVQINAVVSVSASEQGEGFIQFGKLRQLPPNALALLEPHRLQPVPGRYREADKFAWVLPN